MFGLSEQDLQAIISLLQQFPSIEEALIFGSRAKGTYHQGSDVDIALKGKSLEEITRELSRQLNHHLPLPYRFDVVEYSTISTEALKEHIDRIGILFYSKKE